MSLLGRGVVAIWNGIKPEAEDEFLRWHVHEHIPERVSIPGFLRGRRYVAIDGTPKYFNFYETAQTSDLVSAAYLAALNRPSEWTETVVSSFVDTSRTICDVVWTGGVGEGALIETLKLETVLDATEFRLRLAEAVLSPLTDEPGVVGVHLLEGRGGPGSPDTAERRLRGGQDEVAAWVLLVEAVRHDVIERLRRKQLADHRLSEQGIAGTLRRGFYALQFSLTKSELERGGARTGFRSKRWSVETE